MPAWWYARGSIEIPTPCYRPYDVLRITILLSIPMRQPDKRVIAIRMHYCMSNSQARCRAYFANAFDFLHIGYQAIKNIRSVVDQQRRRIKVVLVEIYKEDQRPPPLSPITNSFQHFNSQLLKQSFHFSTKYNMKFFATIAALAVAAVAAPVAEADAEAAAPVLVRISR